MIEKNSQLACQKWLSSHGKNDAFLGRRDQQPEIRQQLALLKDNLDRIENDFSSRLYNLLEEVRQDLERQKKLVQDVRHPGRYLH